MHKEILDAIQAAPVITIFRHVNPDMDAIGSQIGLKKALETLFPEKTILALGDMTMDGYAMDQAEDSQIADSLAIILDSANAARIDDHRYAKAAHTIRIDHHVPVEKIAQLEWIDPAASATGQMLAEFFAQNGLHIGQEAAQLLYQALTADNIRFTIGSVSRQSFEAAAYLRDEKADVVQAEMANNGIGYRDFCYENRVRSKSQLTGSALFAVMDMSDYLSCGLDYNKAKEKVYVFSRIREVEVWALFTQMPDGIHYAASLRSRTIPIRDIAAEFGGGGHENAAGIKNLTQSDVYAIVQRLSARSQEK